MGIDIHKKPFDEGTKAKLSIFQDYLKEWLRVFVARKEIIWSTINIYDFFAGPGFDENGERGTPFIILKELDFYLDKIQDKNLKVNIYLNEFKKEKKEELERHFAEYSSLPFSITIESLDFKEAFDGQYPKMGMKDCANLLFLDQNGVKHISEEVFSKIIRLKRTDFLFFISSSTIKRFRDHPNISKHINIDSGELGNTPYHKIHRVVLSHYKNLIPVGQEYYLAPFSIRKNAGLYGLIFGSGHVLGMQKFLTTSWNLDPERGDANFDIDEDNIIEGQIDLFSGDVRKPKKVELFENELETNILTRNLKTDKDLYLFALTNGFLPKHIKGVLDKLREEKKIKKTKVNLTSKICANGAKLTQIELYQNGTI
jgi:three-Cys-motif partner protein